MFGFEHIKDIRPRFDAGGDSWVPTEALRNGDFSAYSSNITIYDPLTRVPVGSAFVGQPFAGNVIPANRISPVAKKILEYYSQPKNPGLAGNITDSTLPETANYNSLTSRIDQKLSESNRLFGRYSWYNRNSIYNEYFGNPEASGKWFQFQSWQFVVDHVYMINPTTVLNVRYGYNWFDCNSGQQEEARNFDLTRLGFPSQYNALVPEANRYFPRLDFDGTTMIDVAFGNDFRPVTSHSLVATLNKAWGAHALKGGTEIRLYGERSFSRPTTRPASTPSPTPTRVRAAPAAPTTSACRTSRRSCSACRPRRRSRARRSTTNVPSPGGSTCRTTGGSADG